MAVLRNHRNYLGGIKSWSSTMVNKTAGEYKFEWSSKEKIDGYRSVSIEILKTHPVEDTISYNWYNLLWPYNIGKESTLKLWIKTKDLAKPPFVVVQCYDVRKQILKTFFLEENYELKGTNDWQEVKLKYFPPEETSKIIVRLGISGPYNNGGKVWFDNLSIG
jgi:hypothetical protein